MYFLELIFNLVGEIRDFFFSIWIKVRDWWILPSGVADFCRDLGYACADIMRQLLVLNAWASWVNDNVVKTLNLADVWVTFKSWFIYAANAWSWVSNAVSNVWHIIDDWWISTRATVLGRISDLETWTIGELNSLQNTFNTLITNVETWTTTQINNATAAWNTLITNVETWTTTQINNARSTILGIIGDLETWTQTQINTISDTLTNILDWDALWAWITGWWSNRLVDVSDLIDTEFKIWFPFYDDLASLWEDIKLFFTDPEDWLYKSLDRIIERFW